MASNQGFPELLQVIQAIPKDYEANMGNPPVMYTGWVVEPTHLKKNVKWEIFPNFRGENKKCLNPPPSIQLIMSWGGMFYGLLGYHYFGPPI